MSVQADAAAAAGGALPTALKEERVLLLESWRGFERQFVSAEQVARVTQQLPKRIKKKRALAGTEGWEEYYDYIFPDEAKAAGTLKLLQNVQAWKKRKLATQGAADGGDGAAATGGSADGAANE